MKIKYIIAALILAAGAIYGAEQNSTTEDELILKALYYSDQNNLKEAAKYWKKLFELTNNEKYLIEYFNSSLAFKDIKEVIAEIKEVLKTRNSKELYELLGSLYTQEGDTDGIIEVMKNLSDGDDESSYDLAYLYALKGKNKEALEIYKKLYNKHHNWKSLKGILSILVKEKKVKEASRILWEAINRYKMPKEAYLVYVGIIDLEKESDKAVFAFKKLYEMTKDPNYIKQLISLYIYRKDYPNLIKLLEKTEYDNKLLYELYLDKKRLADAYKLLDNLYKKTKEPKWLAEKAVLTYEIAKKYNAVDERTLNEMSRLFKEAFKKGVKNATYYNYYGYTLIDYDKNIQEGIDYVLKALKLEPKNVYYLDSLAWGYYKLGKCQEAKTVMKQIKKLGKIKEDEIIKHDRAISRCKE